jgi:hypothetical protein
VDPVGFLHRGQARAGSRCLPRLPIPSHLWKENASVPPRDRSLASPASPVRHLSSTHRWMTKGAPPTSYLPIVSFLTTLSSKAVFSIKASTKSCLDQPAPSARFCPYQLAPSAVRDLKEGLHRAPKLEQGTTVLSSTALLAGAMRRPRHRPMAKQCPPLPLPPRTAMATAATSSLCYDRPALLRPAGAATTGRQICYRRPMPLLPAGHRLCYRRPTSLQPVGHRLRYRWPTPLLPMAAASATTGRRLCYHRPPPRLPPADGPATTGRCICYDPLLRPAVGVYASRPLSPLTDADRR